MKQMMFKLIVLVIILFLASAISWASPNDRSEDVGVSAILSPPESVVLDEDYALKSVVFNLGTEVSTFDVIFTVNVTGSSAFEVADTFTVTDMPGGAIDTIAFSKTFSPAAETTFQVNSYTVLAGDEDPSNDGTSTTSETFWGLAVWYGNADGSPVSVNINSVISIDAFAQTNSNVFVADVHLCLGTSNDVIDSLFSETEGVWYYPFTEWDSREFYDPQYSPPGMPEGWSIQSYQGFAEFVPPYDSPWLHFSTPTRILTYAMNTVNDPMLIGGTYDALMSGVNIYQGPSNAGDSLGGLGFPVLEMHSPIYILGAGRIMGTVTDEFSAPIEGVIVEDLATSKRDTTASNGTYELPNLYPGLHDVSFSHPNHRDSTITDVNVNPNGTVTLNVQLEPLPFHDVGVAAILSPPAFVQQNVSYPLISQVGNFGNATSTFDVIIKVFPLGGATPIVADTFTLVDMPGTSLDTVTFGEELFTALDTTYELISYTILPEDIDADNDTSTSTSSIFFGVSAWYGNLDVSPMPAHLDDRLPVDVYIQTLEEVYLSYMHLCLGAADQYVESMLSQDEGLLLYPFNEWDIAQFTSPQHSPPNPDGWSSQSFIGYSSIGSQTNPWLHFETPTKAMTFMVKIVNDPLLVGDTVHCFGTGVHPTFGPSSASDTLVEQSYPVIELFSPIYFKAVGYVGGFVTDVMSDPIEGVYVTAVGSGVGDSTDIFGEYFLDSLTIGTYDILFTHPIYRDTAVTGVEVRLRETTIIDMMLSFPCDFIPGDINSDGNVIGSDVTYAMNYLRMIGPPPPDSCFNTDSDEWLYSAADVNGDCLFIGSDVTFLVNYFRGEQPVILFCQYTPPPSEPEFISGKNKLPIIIPQKTVSREDER
ncbi:MAG: hypothetical protein GY839_14600 [candidate division Zixibacteria bacterium]|nr:hypothetical protein [candidate division Zixibacteria bacterium]